MTPGVIVQVSVAAGEKARKRAIYGILDVSSTEKKRVIMPVEGNYPADLFLIPRQSGYDTCPAYPAPRELPDWGLVCIAKGI